MSKPLIALLGTSGSGKSSLANKLQKKYGYTSVKSFTTRAMRDDPADEFTHTFISPDRIADYKDDIVCDTIFNGSYYFATKQQLNQNDIYVLDKEGLIQLYRNYHDKPIISIFLDVPAEIVAHRMESRGDSNGAILSRLQHDRGAFKDVAEMCDFVCENCTQEQQNDICEFIDMLFRYYRG